MQKTPEQLREMVRDILREVVPKGQSGLAAIESVRIGNDAELAGFVQRVLLSQDAIKAGHLRFTLGSAAAAPSATGSLLQGVITEQIVERHAGAGILQLAADAVITPLGRDRARKLGLKIERRR